MRREARVSDVIRARWLWSTLVIRQGDARAAAFTFLDPRMVTHAAAMLDQHFRGNVERRGWWKAG